MGSRAPLADSAPFACIIVDASQRQRHNNPLLLLFSLVDCLTLFLFFYGCRMAATGNDAAAALPSSSSPPPSPSSPPPPQSEPEVLVAPDSATPLMAIPSSLIHRFFSNRRIRAFPPIPPNGDQQFFHDWMMHGFAEDA